MIIKNQIRCRQCRDIIESKNRHDFRTCSCGCVSVDGGHDYLRLCYKAEGDYEELSITTAGNKEAEESAESFRKVG